MNGLTAEITKRKFEIRDGPDVDNYAEWLAEIQNEFLVSPEHFESSIVDPFGPANIERICTTDDWVGYKVEDIANVWPSIRQEVYTIEMADECRRIHERTIEEELGQLRVFPHGEEGVVVFK